MDIIQRNFFRILSAGAFETSLVLEPMSHFKWHRLRQMVESQRVIHVFLRGISQQIDDASLNLPPSIVEEVQAADNERELKPRIPKKVRLSNTFLDNRLKSLIYDEIHSIDTSVETLDLLKIIVSNTETMLSRGMNLGGIISMGQYLRTRGDKVDFVKLDTWLDKLQLHPMAELQGNILISSFYFEEDELPFVTKSDDKAGKLTQKSVADLAKDTAHDWHFKQSSTGFVQNNGAVLRRNLRRSWRYVGYAPVETVSNIIRNFIRSLSEIEE